MSRDDPDSKRPLSGVSAHFVAETAKELVTTPARLVASGISTMFASAVAYYVADGPQRWYAVFGVAVLVVTLFIVALVVKRARTTRGVDDFHVIEKTLI